MEQQLEYMKKEVEKNSTNDFPVYKKGKSKTFIVCIFVTVNSLFNNEILKLLHKPKWKMQFV